MKMHWFKRQKSRGALFLGTVLLCGGCWGDRNSDRRYIPSEEIARRAVETALTQRQNGELTTSLVQAAGPAIHLIDTRHKPGQKLMSFAVLGPTTGDAASCYAVRLTFDNPSEEVRARYVVLGIDPLWVWRYEDYEMLMHWDCPMEAKQ